MRHFVEPVSGVGVHHEFHRREFLADRGDEFEILAGLDFNFDALVSGGQLFFNNRQQSFRAALDSHGHAAGDFTSDATKQRGERESASLRGNVPERVFQSGLGHFMTADGLEQMGKLAGIGDVVSQG